jgi:hypothetical protein
MCLRGFRAGVALLMLLGAMLIGSRAVADAPFEFEANDRVVFLGATLLEREQTEGYLETLLTSRFADKKLTFRNLAWSGDTVFGDSRAAFDTAKEGFERMVKQVHDAKPTVLMLSFGRNESYAGEAGLADFIVGYNKLLDAVADTKAALVFWGLPLLENLGYPLPDSTTQNQNVALYSEAVRTLALERGGRFIDLQAAISETRHVAPLTDNNIHFTNYGHWIFAQATLLGLGYEAPRFMAHGLRSFEMASDVFFSAPLPGDAPEGAVNGEVVHRLRFVAGMEGTYRLRAGDAVIAEATSQAWGKGIDLPDSSEVAQWEALRAVVKEKNRLFFNRWRPQNETYILGFRKHEQGQYAAEIPLYDPLVEAEEKKIAELSTPKLIRYTMHRVDTDQ